MHALEIQLNTQLFNRTSTPLVLTKAGVVYIEWAKQVIDSENELQKKISDIVTNRERTLKIGLSPQKSVQIFPEIIQKFYNTTNNCRIILEEHPSNELIKLLDENQIDILFDIIHPEHIEYTCIPIAEERLLIAAPKEYSFDSTPTNDYPFIELLDILHKPVIMLSSPQYL